MGGIDWSGLDVAAEMFGVDDLEMLVERLTVIKAHKPKDDRDGTSNAER
jgi:hypothetical protein